MESRARPSDEKGGEHRSAQVARMLSGSGPGAGVKMKDARHYEAKLIVVLSVIFGVVNLEMFGVTYLMPFIQASFGLSAARVGILLSGYWAAFSLSSYLFGGLLADKVGKRKSLLIGNLLLFSGASVLSGLTSSFASLLSTRLLMGLLEGPILPLLQSIMAMESADSRRGRNMGIVQMLGSGVLSAFLGPLILVQLAAHFGWRAGFFVCAAPGLVCTAITACVVREPTWRSSVGTTEHQTGSSALRTLSESRNVWLCALGAMFTVAFITISTGFLPLYYTAIRHLQPRTMSLLMSILGLSSVILGVTLPALSDRWGRKPVLVLACTVGVVGPMAAVYYVGSLPVLGALEFLGWAPAGISPLLFATVPSESVRPQAISAVMGLVIGVSTFVGGVAGPAAAGWSAARWGLSMSLYVAAACTLGAAVTSAILQETVPRRVGLSESP